MKRLLIGAALGLLIGVLVATGTLTLLNRDSFALFPATSAVGDSLAVMDSLTLPDSLASDSAAADLDEFGESEETDLAAAEAPDSAGSAAELDPAAQSPSLPAEALEVANALVPDPGAAAAAGEEAPVKEATPAQAATLDPARLAKLISSMPARDAARVLEQMDDSEIQAIIQGAGADG